MGNNQSRPRAGPPSRRLTPFHRSGIDRSSISGPLSGTFTRPVHYNVVPPPGQETNTTASPSGDQEQPPSRFSTSDARMYVPLSPVEFQYSTQSEDVWGAEQRRRAASTPGYNPTTPPPYTPSRRDRLSRVIEDNLPFGQSGHTFPRIRRADRDSQLDPDSNTDAASVPRGRGRRRNRLSQIFHDIGNSPAMTLRRHQTNADSGQVNDGNVEEDMPQLDIDNGPRFDLDFAAADIDTGDIVNAGASSSGHARQRREEQTLESTTQEATGTTTQGSPAERHGALSSMREFGSRLPSLRSMRRNGRGRRTGQDTSMSNVLTIAAHALAATLTGHNPQAAVTELRRAASGIEPDDGSLDQFAQFLQSGRLSSHLQRSMAAADSGTATEAQPPMDFFRMFQLRSTTTSSNDPEPSSTDAVADRMVPVLIVGIRSLQHGAEDSQAETTGDTNGVLAQSGETTPPLAVVNRTPNGEIASRPTSTYSPAGSPLAATDNRRQTWHGSADMIPLPPSESSSIRPIPPPPTPSSAPLSNISSGANTPNGALSDAGSPDHRDSPPRASRRLSLLSRTRDSDRSPSPARRRQGRRGPGMDFLRHGSGSARRRGIIGPDRPPSEGNHRSWIIYVLGGNYPENHPILTAPSLFTDSPTHEDMLLLSSLIGPVKPPVATVEEVAAARGIYVIAEEGATLEAVADDEADESFTLDASQACGICLMSYSKDDIVRRLQTCRHVYHRECVDQWLTTGRNSCPLCRVKGVPDRNSPSPSTGDDGYHPPPTNETAPLT